VDFLPLPAPLQLSKRDLISLHEISTLVLLRTAALEGAVNAASDRQELATGDAVYETCGG